LLVKLYFNKPEKKFIEGKGFFKKEYFEPELDDEPPFVKEGVFVGQGFNRFFCESKQPSSCLST